MKRLIALMICAPMFCMTAQDCSSYLTLSSTPSGCDASGTVTADVTECSTLTVGSSAVLEALLSAFDSPPGLYCVDSFDPFTCSDFGYIIAQNLDLYDITYFDFINGLDALAEGVETSDCIVSWSDSTGNNVGEGFIISGLAVGTYTASLSHSNGCTDAQTVEVVLECGGCMDDLGCNYSSAANVDDSTCEFESCIGCLASTACNYDENAIYPGDCIYPDMGYDCEGNCLSDFDGDGVCDEFEIAGCTDEEAENYDATATDDDGSCYYCDFEIIVAISDDVNNESTGSIDVTISGGSGEYEFAWTGPDAYTSTEQNIDGLAAGVYLLVITDTNGCTTELEVPVGDIVEEWTLKGAFIQSANFGDLDYGTSDPVEIAVTLQYDYAILQF